MKKINSLAILGFILSFIIGPIGIIISIIALGQIKKRKERGKRIAKAGIIIGLLQLVLIILFTIAVALNSGDDETDITSKAPILATAMNYRKQIKNITDTKLSNGTFEKGKIYIFDMANDFSDAESGYVVVDTEKDEYYLFIYDINYMIVNKNDLEVASVQKLNKNKWNKVAGDKNKVCKSVTGKNNACYNVQNEIIE